MKQAGNDVILEARVKPNSGRFGIKKKGEHLIIEVVSPPREGKANAEIIKELGRITGKEIRIIRGFRSRDKVILVKGAELEEIGKLIRA